MLPARIDRAIAAEQDHGERLIGWFQMAVVALFAGLYAAAPRAQGGAFDVMSTAAAQVLPTWLFEVLLPVLANPVPWALAVYFFATVVRLVWSYHTRLPGWSLVISIAIDMVLLMGLIWTFHIQYDQPPAFYLKAPTFAYVFIFIALRALRFDERYVAAAGVAAAFGWLALAGYAQLADPTGSPTTHNYVEYMTSPRILWGGEIDKIFTIVVVSVLLAMTIRRGRTLLMRAVADGEAARELKRFFARGVADQIVGADELVRPGQGEIREAAILFLDLRGFTKLAQRLSPNETVRLLGEYQARMVPIIQRHDGSIDKFLGDGILASFGATRPSARYAADALAAIDDVMDAARAWSSERAVAGLSPISIGGAVASGTVLFGAVGDDSRLELTVIGDAVNLAAKLEKHNKAERVRALTDMRTYTLARTQGFAVNKILRRAANVAGVEAPLDLVVLAQ